MKTANSRLWTPDYCRVFLANLLLLMAGNAMGSMFSLYIFTRGGAELDVGISSYIQAIACLITRPLAGWFLDHKSRRSILMLAVFSLIFVQFGYVFAVSLVLVQFIRFVNSVLTAVATTGVMTNAYDSLSEESFAEGVGFFGFSNSVANAIAPGVGLWLWMRYGAAGVFGMLSVSTLAAYLLLRKFNFHEIPEEKRVPFRKGKLKDLVYEKNALPASILEGFVSLAYGAVNPYLSVFLIQRDVLKAPGLFYTAQACGTFSARLFVGKISKYYGEAPIVYCSAVFFTTGSLGMIFSNSPALILAGAFLIGLGYGLTNAGFQIMSVQIVSEDRRGAASATYTSSWDVCAAFGGLISGVLITFFSYQTTFCLILLIYPIYVLVYVFIISKHPSAFRNLPHTKNSNFIGR